MPLSFRFFCPLAWVVLATPSVAQVLIRFDDVPGKEPPFTYVTLSPLHVINDEYAPLGVRFDSAGGGLACLAPSNPVSLPNSVAATSPGPMTSYADPIMATFEIGGSPAVVDYVQLTLSDSSSRSTLEAFDINGVTIGSSTGGASANLRVEAPGSIHSIVLQQGPFGFDDFIFDGLTAVSGLSTGASPSKTGEVNDITLRGAAPHDNVILLFGLPQSEALPGRLAFDLSAPTFVTVVQADESGVGRLTMPIPQLPGEASVLLQAFSSTGETTGNLVIFSSQEEKEPPPTLTRSYWHRSPMGPLRAPTR